MTKLLSRQVSLQTLLLLPFVGLVTGAVGLVGLLSFQSGQQAVNTLATRLREELTQRIQQQLQTYVETPFLINELNASAFARNRLPLTNLQSYTSLWEQASNFPTTNLIYCADEAEGRFLGVGRPNAGTDTTADLQLIVSGPSTNYLFDYYDISPRGDLDEQRREVGDRPYDPRVRPWYEAAKARETATWSDIYLDFDAQVPVITASVPVYDFATTELMGVCATDFLLSVELNEFLGTLPVGKTGETFIIERDGKLVSSSSAGEEILLTGSGEETERLAARQSQNPLISATATYLQTTFSDLEHLQTVQQLSFQLEGQTQFVQVAPFQDGRGLDWLIVVVVPEADFMQEIHANARNTLLLCLLTLAIAIVAGHLLSRRIAQPVTEMNAASQAIAAGDRDRRVSPSHVSELDSLGRSFNAMAQQLQVSLDSLEAANHTLEQRVAERTAELTLANQEIQALNTKLKAENLRMGAELDVARKLQTMILPKLQELDQISDLDVAGFMQAAEEVGGDYYDVLQQPGQGDALAQVRVGIGDVTGHGLESGVLMIMTQTAVRTLLAIGEHDLTKTMQALNYVIYQNAQRMGLQRQITLALLDYQDGQLWLSGQHESAIVIRANGAVELIDTLELGFPLGLVEDISDFVAQQQFDLAPGDGVVLYTDGITEAEQLIEDEGHSKRHLYGLNRLTQLLKTHWHESASTLRQIVIEDVQRHIGDHKVHDDITLVILKRRSPVESA